MKIGFPFARTLLFLSVFGFAVSLCSKANAQLPVTDGLLLWLDATDPSTLLRDDIFEEQAADGDDVGLWKDKSGNDFHAFQTDDFKRPQRNDTAMGGMPAVRFEGVDLDGMLIDDGLDLARPYTAFIVNQYWGDIRGRTLQGQDSNWLVGLWAGRRGHYAEGWVSGQIAVEANIPMVADAIGDDTQSAFFVNGLDFTTNPGPRGAPGRLALVGEGAFPAEVSDADISEIIIYDRVLDAAELTLVREHLYTKYSVEQLLPPPPQNTILAGTIGTFSGADLGEGADFAGEFTYALNVGGPGGSVVGDATFTDASEAGMAGGSSPGATITDANEILSWHAPAYGDTADDDGLELVMQSIRWNGAPGSNDIDLQVEFGSKYKLQLLFAESCCDRGYDITIEDDLVVDNFNVQINQGGINNQTTGVVYTIELTAEDDILNIVLGPTNELAPDNNAILNGLTLELLPPTDLAADGDLDGDIDKADFEILRANFGTGKKFTEGNYDLVGVVDLEDFVIWKQSRTDLAAASVAAVPEPSSLVLIALGMFSALIAILRRR